MTYRTSCPHCHATLKSGHGDPVKHLGSPLCICPCCNKPYVDTNMIEWEVSPWYKKLSYYTSKNRFMIPLFIIPATFLLVCKWDILPVFRSFLTLVSAIVSFFLCRLMVADDIKKEIPESQARCSDIDYLEFLNKSGYTISNKTFNRIIETRKARKNADTMHPSENVEQDSDKETAAEWQMPVTSDNMIYCPFCGYKIPNTFRFCPVCGKEIPQSKAASIKPTFIP